MFDEISDDQKKEIIRQYLAGKNDPERDNLVAQASQKPSDGAKALSILGAALSQDAEGATRALYAKQNQAKQDLARYDDRQKQLKDEAWQQEVRDRQRKQWDKEDSAAPVMDPEKDPSSPASKMYQQMAAQMMPGKDFSKISAAQLKGMLPTLSKMAESQRTPKKPDLSPAEMTVDKEFAKTYQDYVAAGGNADTEKNLKQLEEVHRDLKADDSLTGPIRGLLPDFIRNITNPKAIDTRDKVQEVVQRNLREILGAQFTEKEGQRLIERAYNEKLDEKTNAARVQRLMDQIKEAAAAKEAAARYYEQNGTLKGFKGRLYRSADEFLQDDKPQASGKTVVKRMYSPSRNQTKVVYSDGSEEVVDGR